ncbi:BAX inhibitor (BI)-1/YccA family protein [Helicobacter sp. MIT 00-7814]|uniref:Bax inhibitor-1/YccA family protein n=1 Tax=unclassified Helicobacter TaxID=2593540 RepID=UPI000E1EBBB3|nr:MULTISPECIES: Bax inhibitor-1/YccA family protein [unclassified Helicobacter]RDU53013.1 BAX inhibitor (BI)-1/YccA family protein [Helicobacter sp. MIT 99-10781]RDU55359.1 BAX inhibitor (BI)-1/YccA family protein [Helicobacter sp. MIT 00-7814]
MALYDRDYTNVNVASMAQAQESALVNFVKTTYKFFGASLLIATIGALVGFMYFEAVMQYRMFIFIAEFAALFGLMFSRSKPGLNIAMLFIFTFLTGLAITPLLGLVIAKNGAGAVVSAFGMTTIIFGVMSIFGVKTKKDLANMGKMLFISLIVVIICSIVNLFVMNMGFQALIAGAVAILFSVYVAYDTQNIVRGLYSSPVDAAIALYLDFYNIFVSLLQLFGIFGSRD